jgi:hypothetical protein
MSPKPAQTAARANRRGQRAETKSGPLGMRTPSSGGSARRCNSPTSHSGTLSSSFEQQRNPPLASSPESILLSSAKTPSLRSCEHPPVPGRPNTSATHAAVLRRDHGRSRRSDERANRVTSARNFIPSFLRRKRELSFILPCSVRTSSRSSLAPSLVGLRDTATRSSVDEPCGERPGRDGGDEDERAGGVFAEAHPGGDAGGAPRKTPFPTLELNPACACRVGIYSS